MRLLFCIFKCWGVCNGVRADSEPNGVVSLVHETALVHAASWKHGLRALETCQLFSPEGIRQKLVQSNPHYILRDLSQIYLSIAWQRASWDFSKYLWQARISTIIRTTLLHTSRFRKAVEIRIQNHLSTRNGPKYTCLCIFWA